ncbi:MAG: Anaerobic glycerol-3-phosphate dehydrogenase subunit [Pseudomonadota bacterium]
MAREGNLEAPTRHPLDWLSEDFYNEESLNAELERVYDICHGCRRCVSLCQSFPTLFDLVDESDTMEVDGVDKKDYMKVVDQCYLCDLCYMTKCPYTPPHEWNLDFPHLMLRAKAVKFKKGEVLARDKFLSDTDGLGKFAGIPIVTQTVNAVNRVWTRTPGCQNLPPPNSAQEQKNPRTILCRMESTPPARWRFIRPAMSTITSPVSVTICLQYSITMRFPM